MQYIIFLIIVGITNLIPNEKPEVKTNKDRTEVIIKNLNLMDFILANERLAKIENNNKKDKSDNLPSSEDDKYYDEDYEDDYDYDE